MNSPNAPYPFKLPDVGEGIHEAEIVRWLAQPGDAVALNQPLLEIQTDKAVVEIPAPVAGTVTQIHVPEGTLARVGDLLVTFSTAAPAKKSAPPSQVSPPPAPAPPAGGIAGPGKRVLAAPAVRKLARQLGIQLSQVRGSGPAGRILPSDVRAFAEQPETPPPAPAAPPIEPEIERPAPPQPIAAPAESSTTEPLRGLRRRMAERLETAWRTIPHITLLDEVDAAELVSLRRRLKPDAEARGVKLTYLPFIAKAAAQTLREFPYFNASLDMAGQVIIKHGHIHLGIATAAPDGLLVPVLRHADRLTTLALAAELNRLAEQARTRKLSADELRGSTFSITNFGSFGAAQGTPIINPPEVAILGVGQITDKPVAVQGQVVVHPVLPLALSVDHRLLDGAAAAQFMARLKHLLADPGRLLLEMA